MKFAQTLAAIAVVLSLAATGCNHEHKFDPTQCDQAILRMDRSIAAVNEAIETITIESDSWRAALDKLEKDLKADAQDVLAHEVHNVASSFAADVGDQLKVAADYIEVKLKARESVKTS